MQWQWDCRVVPTSVKEGLRYSVAPSLEVLVTVALALTKLKWCADNLDVPLQPPLGWMLTSMWASFVHYITWLKYLTIYSCSFGPRTNNILQAFGYDCSGTENSIEDCDLVGATCSPSDTIGVICNTTTTPLPQMGKYSHSKQQLCVYYYRCLRSFTAEGDLRLVGGTNRCEGRLQVSVVDLRSAVNSLQWSTTCDRDFSTEEIRTACRQLGCPTGDPSRQSISRYATDFKHVASYSNQNTFHMQYDEWINILQVWRETTKPSCLPSVWLYLQWAGEQGG